MTQGDGRRRWVRLRCRATAALRSAELACDFALLDGHERDMAQRLRIAEDRRDYVAAHALLRRMLTSAVPEVTPPAWLFDRAPRGKPFVRPRSDGSPALPFSLSHTRGLVACAVAQAGALGLDAERDADFDVEEVMASVCSADETAQLATLAQSERRSGFLDLWTLKEAYAKARGTGITDGLAATTFDLRTAGAVSGRVPPGAATGWDLVLLRPGADSRVALAVEHREGAPIVLDAALIGADGASTTLHAVRSGSTVRGG